jgi:hypothetical protein
LLIHGDGEDEGKLCEIIVDLTLRVRRPSRGA